MGSEMCIRDRDRYILESLKLDGGNLGGEPSGHILLPEITRCGDGLIVALKILELLVKNQKSASALLHLFTPIPQKLVNLSNIDNAVLQKDTVVNEVEKIKNKLRDKGRILLRPSGTEPVIRIMVEAEDAVLVDKTINELFEILKKNYCLLYTSPSPRDLSTSRMPSSA